MEIVQFRGKTGAYLEATPGTASFDLFKMAREGLASALRQAVHQVTKRGGPLRVEGLRVKTNGGIREVGFEVIPIGSEEGVKGRHHLHPVLRGAPKGHRARAAETGARA